MATAWTPQIKDQHISLSWTGSGPQKDTLILSKKSLLPFNTRPDNCQHLRLTVLTPQEPSWVTGKTWGFRYYKAGVDLGGLFLIKKERPPDSPLSPKTTAKTTSPKPMTTTLNPIVTTTPYLSPARHFTAPSNLKPPHAPISSYATSNSLLELILGAHNTLNQTHPDLAQSCWLCFRANPP